MMRFLTLLMVLISTAQTIALGNPYNYPPKKTVGQNDSIIYETIFIGNVTEFSYGQGWINPGAILGNTVNKFNNAHASSWGLSQYLIVNNYLLQSGLEYSTITSDYSIDYYWDSIATRQVLVNDTINTHYYIVDGDSVPEYVIEQRNITQTDTIDNSVVYATESKINCVTIPINLGYRWRFEKFALYLKMGARLNFITSATGKVFFTENRRWQSLDKTIEKKFYYSAATSVAFEYLFSNIGSLIIEPEYRYSLASRMSPGFAKNYHQFGVKFGIQLWF